MIELIQGLMVRLFAGGILCAVAMILAGDGPRREIVRLCCACLMIVFVLTPVRDVSFSLDGLLADREDITRQINQALSLAQEDQLEALARDLCTHAEGRALELGLVARAQVACRLGEQNSLIIDSVRLTL